MSSLSSVSRTNREIDQVIDHLAQGEVYAEYGVTAMYIKEAKEVPDVTDAFAQVGDGGFIRSALSDTEAFTKERFRGSLFIPKLTNEIKVMLATVMLMLVTVAVLSSLTAYTIKHLSVSIKYTYTDAGPQVQLAPARDSHLLNEQKFAGLLEERPEEIVSLYLKRAKLLRKKNQWYDAIDAFKSAALHSVTPIPVGEHLEHVQTLIYAKDVETAMTHLNSLDHELMSPEEHEKATGFLGRLHFAVE